MAELSNYKKIYDKGIVPLLNSLNESRISELQPNLTDLMTATGAKTMQEAIDIVAKKLGINMLGRLPDTNVARIANLGREDFIINKDLQGIERPKYAFRFFSNPQIEQLVNEGKMFAQHSGPEDGKFTDYFSLGAPDIRYFTREWNRPSPPRILLATPTKNIALTNQPMPYGTLSNNVSINDFSLIDPVEIVKMYNNYVQKIGREPLDIAGLL